MQHLNITINKQNYPIVDLPQRPKSLLDRTLADIYGIETRQINRVVNRHPKRFPEDFCFQLTRDEAKNLNKITGGELNWSKGHLPKAFTHYGCNMLATLLESELAIERSIQIIRAFSELETAKMPSEKEYNGALIEVLKNLNKTLSQGQMATPQIISLIQEVSKISERMNILETKIEA